MKLLMLKGLPASGKSTYAKTLVDKGGWLRVNKDDMRAMLHNSHWSHKNEGFILLFRDILIRRAFEQKINVVVDDTNFAPKHAEALKQLAKEYDAEFEVKFFDVPVEECLERNIKRPNPVREKVIWQMYNQFLKPQPDTYEPPEDKPFAILCDIDGTLAHMVDRGPYDWPKVGSDSLDDHVAEILRLYFVTEHAKIILFSGRDSVCRKETEQWLSDNLVPYHQLFMRGEADNRKDSIVKRELFDAHIRHEYRVLFVLDDRNQVVDMWRQMGLKCLQVADGDF